MIQSSPTTTTANNKNLRNSSTVAPASSTVQKQQNLLIVGYSETGNTWRFGEYVTQGAKSVPNVLVQYLKPEDVTLDDLEQCNGLILSSPVHWGQIAGGIKVWLDRLQYPPFSLFEKQFLRGKLGGAFVTSGGVHTGTEFTLLGLQVFFNTQGMISYMGDAYIGQWQPTANIRLNSSSFLSTDAAVHNLILKAFSYGKAFAENLTRLQPVDSRMAPSSIPLSVLPNAAEQQRLEKSIRDGTEFWRRFDCFRFLNASIVPFTRFPWQK